VKKNKRFIFKISILFSLKTLIEQRSGRISPGNRAIDNEYIFVIFCFVCTANVNANDLNEIYGS